MTIVRWERLGGIVRRKCAGGVGESACIGEIAVTPSPVNLCNSTLKLSFQRYFNEIIMFIVLSLEPFFA